ncbi:hypothetical protein J6TS2_41280 [Heyndrickxia sporothermodurans]|nr:hypothetical protein J6TS2_41280 [Heyndrickxia sporothermodurans]
MKKYLYTAIWGVFIWFFATLFFILLGEYVLYSPGTNAFILSTVLLLVGTGLFLLGASCLYLKFDQSHYASLKFGLVGTFIGLTLDTFSLANYQLIFPNLDDSQVIAFTAWMSSAYALYLLIPVLIYIFRDKSV